MVERSEAQIYDVSELLSSGAGAGAAAEGAGVGGFGFGMLPAALPALGVVPPDRRLASPSSGHPPWVAHVV